MLRSVSVAIVGAGNIGANISYLLSEQQIADSVQLYDPNGGQAIGKALDIIEAAPLRRRRNGPRGIGDLKEIRGSDVVVWALEEPPTALQDSGVSYTLEDELHKLIALLADYRGVLIVATTPNDSLVAKCISESTLPPRSIIGLGTLPVSRRLRSAISAAIHINESNIQSVVIGSAAEPLVLRSLLTINGVPIDAVAERAIVERLCDQCIAENATEKGQSISDPFFVAGVATELIESVVYDLRRPLTVATAINGEMGLKGVFSLPAIIGSSGVLRMLKFPLEDIEQIELTKRFSR